MREIKFRAWDVYQKIMLYSDFNALGFFSEDKPEEIAENTDTIFMYHDYTGEKDFVLMQYTGLKDKNGKEIYEGDILKLDIYCYADAEEPTIFTFNDYVFDLAYITQINQFIENYEDDPDVHDSIEVIGNIHQSTELIAENKGRL